eukprot:8024901-Alexandrium_andersonii.AAC.1
MNPRLPGILARVRSFQEHRPGQSQAQACLRSDCIPAWVGPQPQHMPNVATGSAHAKLAGILDTFQGARAVAV